MKIGSSFISLASHHQLTQSYSKVVNFRSWQDPPKSTTASAQDIQDIIRQALKDQLQISDQAKAAALKDPVSAQNAGNGSKVLELSDQDKQKIKMIEELLSAITGRKVKIQIPDQIEIQQDKAYLTLASPAQSSDNGVAPANQLGWGVSYDSQETYQENENLTFSAQGSVQTEDGKKISIDTQLLLSRDFTATNSVSFKAGDALKDPLVINFDTPAAQLTDMKYAFDLNNDGHAEQISFTQKGSGFLALDSNQDGVINNGSELFGPATNDGFSELSQYDQDHNGWIDENDPIFDKLKIWTKDDQGNDQLFALGQKGVGAIFVGNINAAFQLNDSNNDQLGVSRKAGIFLRENGSTGIMQQVDLVV